jgi:hypothetical protein
MTLLSSINYAGPQGRVQTPWVVDRPRDVQGAGMFVGGRAYNPTVSVVYVQIFDAAVDDVELGTTEPVFSMAVPPGRSVRLRPPRPIPCPSGISFAATGSRTGAESPAGPIAVQLEVGGVEVDGPTDAFAFLDQALDFRTGTTNIAARGLDVLRPAAWTGLEISNGALRGRATLPGGDGSNAGVDLQRSWRFGLNAGFQRLGNGVDVEIGPDAATPTPTNFELRAEITATAANGTDPVPEDGGGGQWRFAVVYIDPADARGGCPLSTHGGPGIDGANGQRGIETKYTDEESVYPIEDTDELTGVIRCIRVDDVFTWYWRPASSGEPFESDDGFDELLEVELAGFSGTVRVGFSVYGSPGDGTTIDIAGAVTRIRLREVA